ncbi:Unknown protein [Striga hermonthica]|uniref:Uncharacterized protein n=1 Tax=Striga hermonthica TaxID=68872 RepID=A0A9N7RLS8_STRHE|nr:Unknown protein [Striga hermonthica]
MPVKAAKYGWVLGLNHHIVQWWFKILMLGVFLGILIVWGIDGLNMNSLDKDLAVLKPSGAENLPVPLKDSNFSGSSSLEPQLIVAQQLDSNLSHQNLTKTQENLDPHIAHEPHNSVLNQTQIISLPTPQLPKIPTNDPVLNPWISSELEPNYSTSLLSRWLAPGGEPCKDSRTENITIPGLDSKKNRKIELSTGEIHVFTFQALDETGEPHCLGGDYFETDLSGEKWKSRPPVRDLGNGTHTLSLQVHPEFAGVYNLTVILLYRHYEGLRFSPGRFVFDRVLRVIPIKFVRSTAKLPDLRQCTWSDYSKDIWSGRWTRHAKNDSCPISNDGRYRCQDWNFPCQGPWCHGPLGSIESNGWVYSAHCSFKMFSSREAWNCLDGRWIFWWGDSNHCDTIRNILHFILGSHEISAVPRIFDANITNPKNQSQSVRLTSIFNGHPNDTGNYQGLNSLTDRKYQELLKGYFRQRTVPDTMIMNSGLHDGVYWKNIRNFIHGAEFAASFWAGVLDGLKGNGLSRPKVIYRTTVATGGHARKLTFNPHKMEAFNGVVLDKFRKYGVIDRVIDGFDMTYPWHYDNRANDGVHYGRAPLKMKWRDGKIGHQYFVDLMLGHVLMNALCSSRV